MDFDSIRLELEALEEKLNTLKNAIKVEEKKQKVEELEKETFKDGFWDNMKIVLGFVLLYLPFVHILYLHKVDVRYLQIVI